MINVLAHSISRKITVTLFSFIIFISYFTLQAQSLSIFDIDQSAFPVVKAKFYAFDKDGKQVTNLSPSDFVVKEDGVERKVTAVSCPEAKTPEPVSVAISIDNSESLQKHIYNFSVDARLRAARRLVEVLSNSSSEVAIQTCNTYSIVQQDFTSDTAKLIESLKHISEEGGNDFVEQLLNPNTGLFNIVKTGKNKRIAVLFTDAFWPALEAKEIQRCIDTCKRYNISFYAVIHNTPAFGETGIKLSLKDICESTGGRLYSEVVTNRCMDDIYKIIYILKNEIQSVEPCTIEWESASKCDDSNINLDILCNGTGSKFDYKPVDGSIADLKINPFSIDFKNKDIGRPSDTTITVKAINEDLTVYNVVSNNSAFVITPSVFSLKKGESRSLRLRFTPTDSSYTFGEFDVVNNICPKKIYAAGGFRDKKIKKNTLKLTYPNGGESLLAGYYTTITWEGVLPTDTVRLEFSTDRGISWQLITNSATGLKYKWERIPKLNSSFCLVKISTQLATSEIIPIVEWQQCLGGKGTDEPESIIEADDGGFVVIGSSNSNDGDVSGNHGGYYDAWAIKLNRQGQIQWQKCFGGSSNDQAGSIQQTKDGGYIVTGYTDSNDGDIADHEIDTNYNCGDLWIIKLTYDGQIEWQKWMGGTFLESGNTILESNDGGYIVAGVTDSDDGDVSGNHGNTDIWIIKLDISGNLLWQKCLGGQWDEYSKSIIQTSDKGYIIAGRTNSTNGDVSGNHGKEDCWIVKLNKDGDTQWKKCFGGDSSDYPYSIIETKDGGFVFAGSTKSNNEDVSGNHGTSDYWIVKINKDGDLLWQKCLGGSDEDIAYSVIETDDSNLVIAGVSNSYNGDISANYGSGDCWMVHLDKNGNILSQKSFGSTGYEEPRSMIKTNDKGLAVAGTTYSRDLSGYHEKGDFWISKLKMENKPQEDISHTTFEIGGNWFQLKSLDMESCIVGSRKYSLFSHFINGYFTDFQIDTIFLTGEDANSFRLISNFEKEIEVLYSEYTIQVEFQPLREGYHNAKINFVTKTDTITGSIEGIGINQELSVLGNFIDFGKVKNGQYKDSVSAVTFKNISDFQIYIDGVWFRKNFENSFTVLSNLKNLRLNPGDTFNLDLRFNPKDTGRTNNYFYMNYHYGNNTHSYTSDIQLFGIGVQDDPVSVEKESEAGVTTRNNMLKSIFPNPSTNEIIINYELSENSYIHIYITNILGEKVKYILSDDSPVLGERTIRADLSELSTGTYFIILETLAGCQSERIEIVK